MQKLIQITCCILVFGFFLCSYIDKQNQVTKVKLALPKFQSEVEKFYQENQRLKYEIECFESPYHLMDLVKLPEYSHLRYYLDQDIICIEEGKNLKPIEKVEDISYRRSPVSIASGVSH